MKIAGLIVLTSVFNAAAAAVAVVLTLQMMSPTMPDEGPGSVGARQSTASTSPDDPLPSLATTTMSTTGDQARVVRPKGPVVEPTAPAPAVRDQPPASPRPRPAAPPAQPALPALPEPQPQAQPLPAPQPTPQPEPEPAEASPAVETVSVEELPAFHYTEDDLVEEENLLVRLNANETELSKYRSLGVELIGLSEEVATLDASINELTGNRLGQLRRTLLLGERENKLAHAHELQDSQIRISEAARERNAKVLAEARRQAELEREREREQAAQAQAAASGDAGQSDGQTTDDQGMTTAQANTEALSSGEDPTGLGAAVSDTARITDAIGGFAAALEQKMAEMEQRKREQQGPQRPGSPR